MDSVPDWSDWGKVRSWLDRGVSVLRERAPEAISDQNIYCLRGADLGKEVSLLGYYDNPIWQKFCLSVFLADLVSYSNPADQVTLDRLAFVMSRFPQGFRVWFYRFQDGSEWPVGYSGWYPISQLTFNSLQTNPGRFGAREVYPVPPSENIRPLIYLFNYSLAKGFRKSVLSKKLISEYSIEISNQKPDGLACITVSSDGERVARKFGMSKGGEFVFTRSGVDK